MLHPLTGGIWNMLRKGVGLGAESDSSSQDYKQNTLANQSLNLLLVLINHCTSSGEDTVNIFQESLITFGNEACKVYSAFQLLF